MFESPRARCRNPLQVAGDFGCLCVGRLGVRFGPRLTREGSAEIGPVPSEWLSSALRAVSLLRCTPPPSQGRRICR